MQSCPAPTYRLADHVRACHINGQVILLDLKLNKYVGIGGSQVAAMAGEIQDWPIKDPGLASSANLAASTQPVFSLLRQNMLAINSGPVQEPVKLDASAESLLPDGDPRELIAEARNLPALAWAAFSAKRLLKRKSLYDIAAKIVSMRPDQRIHQTVGPNAALRLTVNSYMRLRPLVLTAHDQCLHDSLSLVHFLARSSLFPRWVIGVRTGPFAAHSWVQSGPVVLNDLHENIAAYTPIMVV